MSQLMSDEEFENLNKNCIEKVLNIYSNEQYKYYLENNPRGNHCILCHSNIQELYKVYCSKKCFLSKFNEWTSKKNPSSKSWKQAFKSLLGIQCHN